MSVDEAVHATGVASVRRLCERAATTDLDRAQRRQLRADAASATASLVARGTLPAHLRVEPSDPWVVVARTLARAQAHLEHESAA